MNKLFGLNDDDKEVGEAPRKSGRRERNSAKSNESDELPSPDVKDGSNKSTSDSKGQPRRKRADAADIQTEDDKSAGGWMSQAGGNSTSTIRRALKNKIAVEEEEDDEAEQQIRYNPANKDKHFQEANNDDIMLIPDIEDDGDSDQRVAHAPRNVARKIPTLSELESDVKSAVPKAQGGLDLSILLSVLVPSSQLIEADTTWTFESLLREVTDELTGTEKTVVSTITKEIPIAKTSLSPTSPSNLASKQSKAAGEKRKA